MNTLEIQHQRQIFHAREKEMTEDVCLPAPCVMESRPAGMDQMRILTSAPPGSVARTDSSVLMTFSVLQRQISASRLDMLSPLFWQAQLQILRPLMSNLFWKHFYIYFKLECLTINRLPGDWKVEERIHVEEMGPIQWRHVKGTDIFFLSYWPKPKH